MKRIITTLCACLLLAGAFASAEDKTTQVVRNGNTFEQVSTKQPKQADIETEYKWKDSKGKEYTIYLHMRVKGENKGKWIAFVQRISQKSGEPYNYYLSEYITETIVKEYGL